MISIQAKIALVALRLVLNHLKKHPEVLQKVADRIPGKLDDAAIAVLLKLI